VGEASQRMALLSCIGEEKQGVYDHDVFISLISDNHRTRKDVPYGAWSLKRGPKYSL